MLFLSLIAVECRHTVQLHGHETRIVVTRAPDFQNAVGYAEQSNSGTFLRWGLSRSRTSSVVQRAYIQEVSE